MELTMDTTKFLYAAYVVTWLIHIAYVGTLVSRYRALARDVADIRRK